MAEYSGTERTRAKLIEAAGELAAKMGFSNVSTRAVARRSGENIGSIHYHFGGKTGLFTVVVQTAISDFTEGATSSVTEALERNASPEVIEAAIRKMIHQQIHMLFNSGKPLWHAQVIYQLLQYDESLFGLFETDVVNPEISSMSKLFRVAHPEMDRNEVLLRSLVIKLPVFAHATYMPMLLKILGTADYTEKYLLRMEDLLVCQTQLLLGLPVNAELM